MKTFSILLICLGLAAPLLAGEETTNAPARIAAADAKSNIDKECIVTGKVAEVNVAERLVRLNFEKVYPHQVFTAVIFAAKTNLFPEISKLEGKTVEVSGKIADYRGRPEIVLNTTNQLKVVEGQAKAEGSRSEGSPAGGHP